MAPDPLDYGIPRGVDALIRRAIAERRLIRCIFDGRERIGEPHDYGVHGDQAELFLWQTRGSSKSGSLPGWRRIRFPDAHDFAIIEERFPGQRAPATGQHRHWDELWARVAPPEAPVDLVRHELPLAYVADEDSARRASPPVARSRRAARRRP